MSFNYDFWSCRQTTTLVGWWRTATWEELCDCEHLRTLRRLSGTAVCGWAGSRWTWRARWGRAGSGLWSWSGENLARGWRWCCARWMPWALRSLRDQSPTLVNAPRRKQRERAALWTSTGFSRICERKSHEGRAGTGRAGGE